MTVTGAKLDLSKHTKPYIRETELAILLGGSDDRRYSWVKRVIDREDLIRLKKGIYCFQFNRLSFLVGSC